MAPKHAVHTHSSHIVRSLLNMHIFHLHRSPPRSWCRPRPASTARAVAPHPAARPPGVPASRLVGGDSGEENIDPQCQPALSVSVRGSSGTQGQRHPAHPRSRRAEIASPCLTLQRAYRESGPPPCSPLQQASTQEETASGKPLARHMSRLLTICSLDMERTAGDTEGSVSGDEEGS